MAKRDKYASWDLLMQNATENVDYRIVVQRIEGSSTAVLAPHGGGIEFMTLPLARSIAGGDHNFYAFEGIKKDGNWDLHITSHRFKEAHALALIADCDRVVTVHGLGGNAKSVQVGGADGALGKAIHDALIAAGFNSKIETSGAYAGTEPLNICNRGRLGKGVQLELKAGLRNALKNDKRVYNAFVAAIRAALQQNGQTDRDVVMG
ncbi:poly-gamma-glutamate hydrolase family protein [Brucella anthropi]|uniref:poly-gamma-glutamate hydrolase family protein n=1 Tax=Brucella anthropi TaxID=529 RepID=UPI000CFB7CB1|nr:poly-gamma-glutamate hydrolase family protein [Ochrobactrum sp. MYb49]PQZ67228.1 replication protein [Ochrobactrum sp. MYb49]